jgi:hypothetical protein
MAPLKAQMGPSILNTDLSSMAIQSQKLLDLGEDYPELAIEVDGGVGSETISECAVRFTHLY